MDEINCNSANNNEIWNETSTITTPPTHKTPVRHNNRRFFHNSYQTSIEGLHVLPNHITPPSGLTKFIARNPFDADLTSRLHLSVISPTVFSKVSPKMSCDSPGFTWSVDELALIQPAKIEEFPIQQMHCTDPDLDKVAQAAIDKFFNENQIIPSPFIERRKETNLKINMLTPSRPLEELNMTRETLKIKKDCWTQTVLTLPPQLPKELEEALKPYFTFNQDQNVEAEDANSSNNSLRRKLFFNHSDCSDDEDETSLPLSPIRTNGSMIHGSSPPQSGMLVHGTPLTRRAFEMERTHGTPYASNISPPNMSPICNNGNNMSCERIKSRCQLAARLDFTRDMSIDGSGRDEKELRPLEDVELDTDSSMLRSDITTACPIIPSDEVQSINDSPNQNKTAEMILQQTTPIIHSKQEDSKMFMSKNNEIVDRVQIAADWCKSHSNESYVPENNTLLGHSGSGQQSTFNFAQDTGYQTYSMSNITGNTDNCSITPNEQNLQKWNEKMLSTGDEVRLSDWKDNMKNMFSSTPSKYSRRKDN